MLELRMWRHPESQIVSLALWMYSISSNCLSKLSPSMPNSFMSAEAVVDVGDGGNHRQGDQQPCDCEGAQRVGAFQPLEQPSLLLGEVLPVIDGVDAVSAVVPEALHQLEAELLQDVKMRSVRVFLSFAIPGSRGDRIQGSALVHNEGEKLVVEVVRQAQPAVVFVDEDGRHVIAGVLFPAERIAAVVLLEGEESGDSVHVAIGVHGQDEVLLLQGFEIPVHASFGLRSRIRAQSRLRRAGTLRKGRDEGVVVLHEKISDLLRAFGVGEPVAILEMHGGCPFAEAGTADKPHSSKGAGRKLLPFEVAFCGGCFAVGRFHPTSRL